MKTRLEFSTTEEPAAEDTAGTTEAPSGAPAPRERPTSLAAAIMVVALVVFSFVGAVILVAILAP